MENKEKKVDENTINYYKPNTVLPTIMTSIEVVYSLICMALYLLIIYWNAVDRKDVVIGKYDGFESEEEIINYLAKKEEARKLNEKISKA